MSVVCFEFLAGHDVQINRQATAAIGANGAPLDVIGHTQLAVSLGAFQAQYQFTVVQHLTVDCLLGADFLQDVGAFLDCRSHTQRHAISYPLHWEKIQFRPILLLVLLPSDLQMT